MLRFLNINLYLHSQKQWRHSSAGSEHLPYKQRVTGSNPVASTNKIKGLQVIKLVSLFYLQKICKIIRVILDNKRKIRKEKTVYFLVN